MHCIVCEGMAERIEPRTLGATAVQCPSCGAYEISGIAEATLAHQSPHQRLQALRFAQTGAPAGRLPFIHG